MNTVPPVPPRDQTEETSDIPPPPPPVQLVTTAVDYPTIFADGVWFAAYGSGVIKLTFIETLWEPMGSRDPGTKNRHVGTLAMPYSGFEAMVDYLNEQRERFRAMNAESHGKN